MVAVVSQLEQRNVGRGHVGGRGTHFGPQVFEQTQKKQKQRRDVIPVWLTNRKWCTHILDPKYGSGTPKNPD